MSTISQSVLLSGATGGQGQMYLRVSLPQTAVFSDHISVSHDLPFVLQVNRSLRPPMSPQLIFMPGSTATAAVATVAQQSQSHQQQEVTPASSSSSGQSDNDQVCGVTEPMISSCVFVRLCRRSANATETFLVSL